MPTETGDMKVLGNFRKLIDFCAAVTGYVPPNPLLEVAPMDAQHAAGLAAVEDIAEQMAPNKIAINQRAAAYDEAVSRYRRSRSILKVSGAPPDFINDAETFVRKIVGKKKTTVVDNPDTPENEALNAHSASQQSYDAILGNINSYNQLVAAQPLYKPNENELKIAALLAVADDLEAKNNAVSTTFVPLSNARHVRDRLLYTNADCIVNVALLVKEYAKATNKTLYNQIKGLNFERMRRLR